MKSNTFNYSLLAIGVAAVMGLSNGVNAGITILPKDAAAINITNQATATYSVGSGNDAVSQPEAKSNIVTVKVIETGGFSLIGTSSDGTANDDKNQNQKAVPGTTTTFTHKLSNDGNVTDTYTIATTSTNDTNILTTASDYNLGTANVSYTIQGKNGAALTQSQKDQLSALSQPISGAVASATAIPNGGSIKLLPNTEAILSYDALTVSTANGNQNGVGTLSATSAFFTSVDSTNAKLVNENQALVRLPTYKIVKTATSNVDLSVPSPTILYKIIVTNVATVYEDTATDFVIRDALPAGMTLADGATSVTTTNGKVTASNVANSPQVIDVAVPSLAAGSDVVIEFRVNVNRASYTGANSSATNNVAVYDKFAGAIDTLPTNPIVGTNYDILDSTVTANDVTRVPKAADDANGLGEDTAGVTNFSNRALALAKPTVREIAPTSGTLGQVTHQATITNNGQDIEGNLTNPLTLTITDGNNAAVNPVLDQFYLVYTPPNGGTATPSFRVEPTKDGNVYTISSSKFPNDLGIEPGGKLTVSYNMASTTAVIGSSESTIVKLTASGNGSPTIESITDTTNVKGLTLDKFQALDETCTGTAPANTFTKDAIEDAKPDQCIIYRIDAKNTSSPIQTADPAAASGFNITGLTISDLLANFSAGASLVTGTAISSATTDSSIGNANVSTTAITATMAGTNVLAPQGVATLNFRVKIKNARTTP